jgi:hypothetical protein
MARQTLGDLEEHTFYILFIGFLVIVFWQAIWGLIEELTAFIERKYGVKKWKTHALLLMGVILLVETHPKLLEKI